MDFWYLGLPGRLAVVAIPLSLLWLLIGWVS